MTDNLEDRPVGPPHPLSLDDIVAMGRARLAAISRVPEVGLEMLSVVVLLAFVGWLATGIYKVQPDERGLVLQFGQLARTADPGLNYHLPYPIETVILPKVTQIHQVEVGSGAASRMLTGDENIVEADATVFWKVRDPADYAFKVVDPQETVKVAADSAIRDVIGRNPIQRRSRTGARGSPTRPRRCCSPCSIPITREFSSPRCSCNASTRRSW